MLVVAAPESKQQARTMRRCASEGEGWSAAQHERAAKATAKECECQRRGKKGAEQPPQQQQQRQPWPPWPRKKQGGQQEQQQRQRRQRQRRQKMMPQERGRTSLWMPLSFSLIM